MRFAPLLFIVALLCIAAAVVAFAMRGDPTVALDPADTATLQLAGQTIHVAVASTEAAREKGLGGRSALAPNEGMLFVFQKDGVYSFWMKDMRFSLDIVWLADDGRIVYAVQNVSPDTYPHSFTPSADAKFVLELPAGWLAAHKVGLGTVAVLPNSL